MRWARARRLATVAAGLDIPGGPLAPPPTGADQAGCGQAAKPGAEGIGCGHDECVELALGVGGGLDRGAAGGQPHRQRHAMAGGTRLGELVATQGFAAALAASSDRTWEITASLSV